MFFAISLLRNQGSPCPLRGSLTDIFSGLLIWMQYVKISVDKMCPRTEISCKPLGNKGFVNVLNGNSVPPKVIPHENNTPDYHY